MSFRVTALKRSLLCSLFLGVLAVPAFPQAKDSPLVFDSHDGVTTSLAGTSGSSDQQWLKVEFHYSVTLKEGQGDYLPSATFKVWIEGLDPLAPNPSQPGGKGVAVAFTGSVTYINIHQGKDCYGVVYVHPSTLGRYSGADGVSEYDRKYNVHVEATVGYALADYFDKNKEEDPNWYKALRPIPGLVYRQDQCPFLVIDPDKYPAIAPPQSSDSPASAAASLPPSPPPAPPPAP